jgi:hypothetical protein
MMIEALIVVMLSWSPPTERVNGNSMAPDEIGGYEIRVECQDEPAESLQTQDVAYEIELPDPGACEFYVATYDTDGIYSDFVKAVSPTLKAPTRGGIR